ncbi:hypothetical protein C8F04DRAFT_1258750 [Mycena alexandri]|uniref:Uncharacterized protein n=1 Tax=Mycena alexandri TaxID=1745969 RepID=A0AAD6SWV3_9AGAR|nr:hypothetical protein C8F04DRAFT_1258750 [Mycena alexandri]
MPPRPLQNTQQVSEWDSDEEAVNGQDESGNAAAPGTTDVPAPKPFNFKTPEGIKEFVEWAHQKHAAGSMAFHWRQWGDGIEKKGLFLSYLIVYTYAFHLTIIKSIPTQYC